MIGQCTVRYHSELGGDNSAIILSCTGIVNNEKSETTESNQISINNKSVK